MSAGEEYIYFKLIPIVLSVWLRDRNVYLKPPDFEDVCSELYMLYRSEDAFDKKDDNMALLFSMFYIRIPKAIKKLRYDNILVENIDDIENKDQVLNSINKHSLVLMQISDAEMELLKEAYIYEENINLLAEKYGTSKSSIYGKLEGIKRKLKKLLEQL